MPDPFPPTLREGEPRQSSLPASQEAVRKRFGSATPLVGMVHLGPLPGSPRFSGSMAEVVDRAVSDAEAILAGGFDGVLVENFGDAPFHPNQAPPETIAGMVRALEAVARVVPRARLGVNVLRNDAAAAVAIAAAGELGFFRVNVHAGTMVTDQGTLSGEAHQTLRSRTRLGADPLLLADLLVKHAHPPVPVELEEVAREMRGRALADVLLLSGRRTGSPPDPTEVERVRKVLPEAPLWIGSGLTLGNATQLLDQATGAIVGTTLHRGRRIEEPIELSRVREFVAAVRGGGG